MSIATDERFVTISEAAAAVGKTSDNIRDYIQRGRIGKYNPQGERIARARNGELRVDLDELREFLKLVSDGLEKHHHAGLSAELGFYGVAERDRTKHVHRLHPYLGKFIPQLVEWFLVRFFKKGDLIVDPFMGSGTTLVQANELGIGSIGVDISAFNCRIAHAKTETYDVDRLRRDVRDAEKRTWAFSGQIDLKEGEFDFSSNAVKAFCNELLHECKSDFLRTWFAPRALLEILYYRRLIETQDYQHKDLLRILLSRAVRSSRLVPHNDLATPKKPLPVGEYYYCEKHDRMCLPIDNCIKKIHAYSEDTVRRVEAFAKLRTRAPISVVQGDSRNIDLTPFLAGRKLDGVFSSPPYVGQIDYHEQHMYAYELFGIPRRDELEIGPKSKGKSRKAKADYVDGISAVLLNLRPHLKDTATVAIVANDKFGLYPDIAARAGLVIADTYHRAVTKRTEKGGDPYQETIFIMRKSNDLNTFA